MITTFWYNATLLRPTYPPNALSQGVVETLPSDPIAQAPPDRTQPLCDVIQGAPGFVSEMRRFFASTNYSLYLVRQTSTNICSLQSDDSRTSVEGLQS